MDSLWHNLLNEQSILKMVLYVWLWRSHEVPWVQMEPSVQSNTLWRMSDQNSNNRRIKYKKWRIEKKKIERQIEKSKWMLWLWVRTGNKTEDERNVPKIEIVTTEKRDQSWVPIWKWWFKDSASDVRIWTVTWLCNSLGTGPIGQLFLAKGSTQEKRYLSLMNYSSAFPCLYFTKNCLIWDLHALEILMGIFS